MYEDVNHFAQSKVENFPWRIGALQEVTRSKAIPGMMLGQGNNGTGGPSIWVAVSSILINRMEAQDYLLPHMVNQACIEILPLAI